MSARAVVRDVGRVLGYPYAEVDARSQVDSFEAEHDAGARAGNLAGAEKRTIRRMRASSG